MELKISYKELVVKQEPEHINDLCIRCKLFRSNTNLNNGYGCLEQEKDYPGKCFAFDCPLSVWMGEEDWKERGDDPNNYSDEWVLPYRKVEKII